MTLNRAVFMLSPMPEKKDKVKTSRKTTPKKSAEKTQSKTRSRSSTAAKKKPRSSTARKKQLRGNIIAALVILCVLLLGLNLVLVLKLLPNIKSSLQPNDSATETQVEKEVSLAERKPNEPLPAEKKDMSPSTATPQAGIQTPRPGLQQSEHTSAQPETKTSGQPKQEPVQSKKRKPEPANIPTVQKEKPTVRQTPQKPVPEKPAVSDRKPAEFDKRNSSQPARSVQPAAKPEKPRKPSPYAGNLTFVFDDAGHNLDQLEHFLRLPFPCTIAVLPGLRYSSESARRIRNAGKQVILHQPMQSIDLHIDPGPGAVTPGLSGEQIKNIVRKNLEEIWPVAGMNNHEGSLITADEEAMSAVLDVVAEKHIFFLDSRTTARSVVAKIAKEKNMVVWERAIFIDNDKNRAAMEAQIKKGLSIAKRKGSAIMIGHVFTVELAQLLTEMYPTLIEEGFSLSAIAQAAQKGTIE